MTTLSDLVVVLKEKLHDLDGWVVSKNDLINGLLAENLKMKSDIATLQAEHDATKAELDALKAAPVPTTVEDPAVLADIKTAVDHIGGIVAPSPAPEAPPVEASIFIAPVDPVIDAAATTDAAFDALKEEPAPVHEEH